MNSTFGMVCLDGDQPGGPLSHPVRIAGLNDSAAQIGGLCRSAFVGVGPMADDVGRSLISMMELDQRTLSHLTERGEIGPHQPYHPTLRQIHEANARALREIIDEMGWPGISQVGERAGEAAWLIAQHAVFDTDFMSYCADLLEDAVSKQDAEGWQLAFLRDRLCTMSGKEQIYGTQFDQDADGWPIPFPIQDPAGVDERRREIGLNSLAERLSEMVEREEARREAVRRADRRGDA